MVEKRSIVVLKNFLLNKFRIKCRKCNNIELVKYTEETRRYQETVFRFNIVTNNRNLSSNFFALIFETNNALITGKTQKNAYKCTQNLSQRKFIIISSLPKSIVPATGYCGKLQERARKNLRFLQENTGNQRNMEAVFGPETFRTFSWRFPASSCRKEQEFAGKMPVIFPAGILLPRCVDFRCFPAETGPYSSIWVRRLFNWSLRSPN